MGTVDHIAGWNISAINHQERLFTSKSTVDIFGFNRFDSPTLSEITADGQVDYKTNELEVPYYNNVSEAVCSISRSGVGGVWARWR